MSTLFDLTGKTAFVTGGSKGLGKAMARAFAEHGADVFINSRHEDELRSAIQEITEGTSVPRRVRRCGSEPPRRVGATSPSRPGRDG